tara:strand:+ start:7817 stop:8737 length:921 start_codon:yes stop_codon:yes gene_type:complete
LNLDFQAYIFTARSDAFFINETLPPIIKSIQKAGNKVTLILDTRKPSGVLGCTLKHSDLEDIMSKIEYLQKSLNFSLDKTAYDPKSIRSKNKLQFDFPYKETHCFRGYPLYGSFKQFIDTDSDYVLHLDCDMIFYEDLNFSWIKEGIRVMEENEDILCVLPKAGPPTKDGTLYQGTTTYQIDEKRGLYLFKNFTSRHYLIHRERFMTLLPLKPLWLSWREPLKSRLCGNGKMLCWETMVEHALKKSNLWRADLMTDQAWSLHPGDRSENFYQLLPRIIQTVNHNKFPDNQRGYFDLCLKDWNDYLN